MSCFFDPRTMLIEYMARNATGLSKSNPNKNLALQGEQNNAISPAFKNTVALIKYC